MPKISIMTVNKALSAMGAEEMLMQGKNYFYFAGGDAFNWPSTMVCVYKINDLSLDEWLNQYKSKKAQNVCCS